MKPYLTKKRLDALHIALSIDDILYEKYRRLNERLQEDIRRLYHPKNRIVKVIRRSKDYDEVEQVEDIVQTGEGFIVYLSPHPKKEEVG